MRRLFLEFFLSILIVSAQVSESFEDASFPPTGWAVSHDAGTTDWERATTNPQSGSAHANSSGPAAGANKTLQVNLNVGASATSLSYYVTVSSITSGLGTMLNILASPDGSTWTLLRSIDLEDNGTFTTDDVYVQFTDFIDGSVNNSGNSIDLRGDADAYIKWVHNKTSGSGAATCRLDNIEIANSSPLPVELTSFSAIPSNNSVELNWKTATEVNNYGFQVQRAKEKDKSENLWEDIGFVQGNGTTNSPKEYSFVDNDLPNSESVDYRLKQIDNDGTFAYSKVVEVDLSTVTGVEEGVEYTFALNQNYPNPFNPTTSIKYQVANTENVALKVYDVLGNEVKTLVNETQNAGEYKVKFNASNLASGIYFYKLQAGNFVSVKKLMLMK